MKMLFKEHSNHYHCTVVHILTQVTMILGSLMILVPFMHLGKESNVDEDAL